jgi:hypothetical protein
LAAIVPVGTCDAFHEAFLSIRGTAPNCCIGFRSFEKLFLATDETQIRKFESVVICATVGCSPALT